MVFPSFPHDFPMVSRGHVLRKSPRLVRRSRKDHPPESAPPVLDQDFGAMAMLVGGAITILKHMWICMDSYMGIYIYGNIYGNMWVNMGISMGISGNWLVVQTHHLEKWWTTRQWLADDIPYMKWNIIQPCSKPPTSMAMSSLSIWEWWSPGDLRDRLTVLCGKTRTGWWLSRPSEKYESQLGWFLQIYGKITNVPNHQPENGDFLEHLT